MAGFKDTFKRIETKYLLEEAQYEKLMERLSDIAKIDEYGETSILNIYFDTPNFELIRRSIEKPIYKEKLRLRSYGIPNDDTRSFIEIKKKYDKVVYKRRIGMPYKKSLDYLVGGNEPEEKSQISNEIDYFLKFYKGIKPAMAISYDRIAMKGIYDEELRITFDRNIRWRVDNLDLKMGNVGNEILKPGQRLMELKIAGAMPLEIAHIFSELGIVRISFSKYGRGYLDYQKRIMEQEKKIVKKQGKISAIA